MQSERIQQIENHLAWVSAAQAEFKKALEYYLSSVTLGHDPKTLERKWSQVEGWAGALKQVIEKAERDLGYGTE